VLKSLKKTVDAVKISVEKLSKGVGVYEVVRWDISVLTCIKLYIYIYIYIYIGDQESLRSYTDAAFMDRRPKATWAEGIRGLMGEKGLMEEDWKDRDKWKKKII